MSKRWYVTFEGKTLGPVPTDQLLQMLSSGRFQPGELVWQQGTDAQIPVQRFLEMARSNQSQARPASVPAPSPPPEKWHLGQPGRADRALSRKALQRLADRGEVLPTDVVWREAPGGWVGTEVRSVVTFPASTAAGLPSWLSDVGQAETVRKAPPPPVPDWMDDVRQSEKLTRGPVHPAAPAPPAPPPSITIPLDWMEDIRHIEESLRQAEPPAPKPVPPPTPAKAAPTLPATPTAALPVAKPAPPPTLSTPAPPLPAALAKTVVRPAPAITMLQPTAPPPALATVAPPKPVADERGFDPETGQIHDPAAYQRWQKEEQHRRQAEAQKEPALCVFELFLNARRDLERWVDADENKALVLGGNVEVLWQSAALQERRRPYEGYGSVMRDKLHKHFALLVENRRKYQAAVGSK